MAREHPRYADTEWPEYEFHEFPMMVYPGSKDGGKTPDKHETKPGKFLQTGIIVNTEEERREVLGIDAEVPADRAFKSDPNKLVDAGGGAKRLATEADERAALLERAEVLGVTVDKRWSLARIEDAIQTHQAEVV